MEPKINSRNIPLPIQREVRKRCGFGCVICGLPLYEYDHIWGWADAKEHVAEEITLLCDQHHREKTSGLLPVETVTEANNNPHNRRSGVSKPYALHFSGSECEISIGGNRFTAQDQGYGTLITPIVVDQIPLIAFALGDGHLLLNLLVFDEFNDLVLAIGGNQLQYSTRPWDIQLTGHNLVIREASRKFLIDIFFDPPNGVRLERGRFLLNGVELLIRPDYVAVANLGGRIMGSVGINCQVGIVIGPHRQPPRCMMRMHIAASCRNQTVT
jgi:hypothetical protein